MIGYKNGCKNSAKKRNRRVLPVARLPASDKYLFASGEHCASRNDETEVTRLPASDCRQQKKARTAFSQMRAGSEP